METDKNIPVLYSLRAIAIVSVILCHYVTLPLFNNSCSDFFLNGGYGVEMFFVISGFVIPWSMYNSGYKYKNFPAFLFKRFVRLEPPYIVSVIFALLILYLRHELLTHTTAGSTSFTEVALHFGYLIPFFPNYHWLIIIYWSLAIEFQFYLFIAIMYVPILKGKIWVRLALYAITCISAHYYLPQYLLFTFPCFMLGILLFLRKIKIKSKISNAEFYLATLLIICYCINKFTIGFGVYLTVAVIAIAFFENWNSKLLNPVGKMSYSIYLFHTVTGGSLILLLYRYVETPFMKILLIVAAFMITMISSYILFLLVERPSKTLSEKFKYGQ